MTTGVTTPIPRPTIAVPQAAAKVRVALIAGGSAAAARSFASQHGFEPILTLSKRDLLSPPVTLRRRLREAGPASVFVHSEDWSRQVNPQLYELALLLLPARSKGIMDSAQGRTRLLTDFDLARSVMRLAPGLFLTAASTAGQAALVSRELRRPPALVRTPHRRISPAVMVIWPSSGQSYGGSVSHLTGILGGFRAAGVRVGIVTTAPPADEIGSVADDLEVTPPLRPRARLTGDTAQLASNRPLKEAAASLAGRLRPSFVYQRHSPFLMVAPDLQRALSIPFVLEWNSSELYIRRNWNETLLIERCLDPLLNSAERAVVLRATVIAAVSDQAAEMAVAAGAQPSQLLVLPNGVDIRYVDRCLNESAGTEAPEVSSERGHEFLLGWAGTFGSWHGASMIVRALAELPASTGLVMIGDGNERAACQRLARELGVDGRINWCGALPRPQTLRRLAACDLLVSPHVPLENGQAFFGSPTKLFEFMALGKPIVASRLAQIGEILQDGVTARLVTPGDVRELAAAISQILASPDRGQKLSAAARREAESRHTWDHRARSVLSRLEQYEAAHP